VSCPPHFFPCSAPLSLPFPSCFLGFDFLGNFSFPSYPPRFFLSAKLSPFCLFSWPFFSRRNIRPANKFFPCSDVSFLDRPSFQYSLLFLLSNSLIDATKETRYRPFFAPLRIRRRLVFLFPSFPLNLTLRMSRAPTRPSGPFAPLFYLIVSLLYRWSWFFAICRGRPPFAAPRFISSF